MAQYPDVVQIVGSQMMADDGTILERSVSGKARLRSYFNNVELTAQIAHECDGPEKDAIWAHYLLHRGIAFQFLYHGDGQLYNVMYLAPPERIPTSGTDRWRVNTQFLVES